MLVARRADLPDAIDWDLYRHFLAVAQTGSLSAAAKRLGESQPTVGRRVDRLERALGARLFQRSPRGFGLTAAGRGLLELVLRMEQDAAHAERLVQGRDERLSGRVRVSASEGLGVAWLVPRLVALRARHPELALELLIDNAPLDLLRGSADVALRLGRPGSPELVGRRIGSVGFGFYASREYVAAHGAPRRIGELARHPVVRFAGPLAASPLVAWLDSVSAGAPEAFTCNSLLAALAAVAEGVGIGTLACAVADRDPRLVRVLPGTVRGTELWLVTHRDLRATPRVRAVLDFIAAAAREDRTMLSGVVRRSG